MGFGNLGPCTNTGDVGTCGRIGLRGIMTKHLFRNLCFNVGFRKANGPIALVAGATAIRGGDCCVTWCPRLSLEVGGN